MAMDALPLAKLRQDGTVRDFPHPNVIQFVGMEKLLVMSTVTMAVKTRTVVLSIVMIGIMDGIAQVETQLIRLFVPRFVETEH